MGGLATPDCLSREGSPGADQYSDDGQSNHSITLHSHNGAKIIQSAPTSPKPSNFKFI